MLGMMDPTKPINWEPESVNRRLGFRRLALVSGVAVGIVAFLRIYGATQPSDIGPLFAVIGEAAVAAVLGGLAVWAAGWVIEGFLSGN